LLKRVADNKNVESPMKRKKAIAQRYEQVVDMAGDV